MDPQELRQIAEDERQSSKPTRVRCCVAEGCLAAGSAAVKGSLDASVEAQGLGDAVEVRPVGCLGLCSKGPLVRVDPDDTLFGGVTPDDAPAILSEAQGHATDLTKVDTAHPFFAKQLPIATENSGVVDPERIESYIAEGGYESLFHVLREKSPADAVAEMTRSGLRGRGGAGFPVGLKWATVAKMRSERKYVVCNADEGDPGAFMDRSIMESDPHRVLEGMAIAAYAVGASVGYIYVRGEYPLAIQRLRLAIRQANRSGLLGTHIFESPFDFRVDIRVGAGAFVCGEETALLASIEGKRGSPRPRPPYPAESGLWGYPTLINNVETLANVPTIVRKGAEWFASIGTDKSKGTKVFSLTGQIENTGVIEVPMGTSLRVIVEEMGGGAPNGSRVKAVQTGGSSGGCIPAGSLDTPVDYESLAELGSMMGSGGMVVLDDQTSMPDLARFFMEFNVDESCGKCVPCRAGTVQLQRMLSRFAAGEAREGDLPKLEDLCELLRNASLCGLGQNAPNPVFSTLRHFREEYEAGIARAPNAEAAV